MKTTVDPKKASAILKKKVQLFKKNGWTPSSSHKNLIRDVILGSHLTYRYILFTALLAKITNPSVNPLALQSGSSLTGAYDARSLCHKVIVPFERKIMGGRLGESNEPFLNKPARFKELSKNNAVRRGRDEKTLNNLILILSKLSNKKDATKAFKDAIYYIFQRESRGINAILSQHKKDATTGSIVTFSRKFINKSCEGETCALIAGTALSLMATGYQKDVNVIVHPINQSGASSREVLDIDIFSRKKLIWTVEVKDKAFTQQDVDHAIKKSVTAKIFSLIFVMGPNATHDLNIPEIESEWSNKGVNINFVDIMTLTKIAVIIRSDISLNEFVTILDSFSKSARTKDEVSEHLKSCLADFWVLNNPSH